MSEDTPSNLSRRQLIKASAATSVAVRSAAVVGATAGLVFAESHAQAAMISVENYILARLSQCNAKTLFGISGATCSSLFDTAVKSNDVSVVVTSSDLAAGQAADGYARTRGLGAVAVTYGVGTMGLIAAIAGAYVERSPVVVINGGPSALDLNVQNNLGSLFTHSIGHTQTDFVLFKEVTEYAVRVEKASDAPAVVDKALTVAKTKQRPVYIEIARDVWGTPCPAPGAPLNFTIAPSGNETELAKTIVANLRNASKPVVLLGIEVQRYGLADDVTALVTKLAIPWSTTLLAKAVIAEQTPGFIGVYDGEEAAPRIARLVEGADALLALGCVWGRQYRRLVQNSKAKIALAFNGAVKIGANPAQPASLAALVTALRAQPWIANPALIAQTKLRGLSFDDRRTGIAARPAGNEPGVSYDDVLRGVSDVLNDRLTVLTDTSLSMYAVGDLNVSGRNSFLCNAVWQSIGYAVGAALGVGIGQSRRPLVLCGDGGFQVTAQSLSALAREKLNAIVIVLDNGLQGIEQWLLDSSYFADQSKQPARYLKMSRWQYADLAKAMGFGFVRAVDTASAFHQALADGLAQAGPAFIAVTVKPHDLPSGLPTS
jgi:indolepyruvate decarboxylase